MDCHSTDPDFTLACFLPLSFLINNHQIVSGWFFPLFAILTNTHTQSVSAGEGRQKGGMGVGGGGDASLKLTETIAVDIMIPHNPSN